jgi:hypothetical protein
VHHGYKFLDGKTGVEPEESEMVASVELGHVQVLEGQEVDTSSSSPNYVEQSPGNHSTAGSSGHPACPTSESAHTPSAAVPIPPPVSSCPANASVNGLLAGASTEDEQQIKRSTICDAL